MKPAWLLVASCLVAGALSKDGHSLFSHFSAKRKPRSKPTATDPDSRGKYADRQPLTVEDFVFKTDASGAQSSEQKVRHTGNTRISRWVGRKWLNSVLPRLLHGPQCGLDVDLLWSVELGSSVYSTPTMFPLFRDGHMQSVFATFSGIVEVVDSDGRKVPGASRAPSPMPSTSRRVATAAATKKSRPASAWRPTRLAPRPVPLPAFPQAGRSRSTQHPSTCPRCSTTSTRTASRTCSWWTATAE